MRKRCEEECTRTRRMGGKEGLLYERVCVLVGLKWGVGGRQAIFGSGGERWWCDGAIGRSVGGGYVADIARHTHESLAPFSDTRTNTSNFGPFHLAPSSYAHHIPPLKSRHPYLPPPFPPFSFFLRRIPAVFLPHAHTHTHTKPFSISPSPHS